MNSPSNEIRVKSIPNEILLQETAQLIAKGHTVTHTVRGNSMNPFLVDRRDRVVLAPFSGDDLKVNAFILAREAGGRIVLHRIIRKQGKGLVLMGDGNITGTEQSDVNNVMALVTQVIRKGKTYNCNGRSWRIYSWWWIHLRPLRRVILGVWRKTIK